MLKKLPRKRHPKNHTIIRRLIQDSLQTTARVVYARGAGAIAGEDVSGSPLDFDTSEIRVYDRGIPSTWKDNR